MPTTASISTFQERDTKAIADAATHYAMAQRKAGHTCTYAQAVQHVTAKPPGPVPLTRKEIAAAASKYCLEQRAAGNKISYEAARQHVKCYSDAALASCRRRTRRCP